MPLTAFQEDALSRLLALEHGSLRSAPAVVQNPYIRPTAGEANQFLVVEWSGTLTVYIYDAEIGFDAFTLEREDFRTDEDQITGMIEEIKHRLTNVS